MTTVITRMFKPDHLERIESAVREVEALTSGEVVPYVVDESDGYEDALLRGSIVCGVLTLTVLVLVRQLTSAWLAIDISHVAILVLVAGGGGAIVTRFFPTVKRFLAGPDLMERRVSQRAAEAFISEEVFNTRDRSGILIFISLLERKVVVMGDSGINQKVKKDEWETIVQDVVEGIRSGTPTDGLVKAIKDSGALLQKHGLARRKDDINELRDTLRTPNS